MIIYDQKLVSQQQPNIKSNSKNILQRSQHFFFLFDPFGLFTSVMMSIEAAEPDLVWHLTNKPTANST